MCCGGLCLGICALCGVYKLSQLRLRDCSCIKWCMRKCGCDDYDDFDLMMIVHAATYTTTSRRNVCIRISAGRQSVQTNSSSKGIFQEALQVFVEQGTQTLNVDMMDGKTIVASVKLKVSETILKGGTIREKEFPMQSKVKGIVSPCVKLTASTHQDIDVEKAILTDMNLSRETEILLHQQLQKGQDKGTKPLEAGLPLSSVRSGSLVSKMPSAAGKPSSGSEREREHERPKSAIEVIAQGLRGNLELLGSMGGVSLVYAAVSGPPVQKKYCLCVYKDEKELSKGGQPQVQIELLKVLSIQEDPGRSDVFQINFVDNRKTRERVSLRRVDMPASTWVELLNKLVKLLREDREVKSSR